MAKFIYPTDTTRVTSGFRGSRPDHHGVDLAEPVIIRFMQRLVDKLVALIIHLVMVNVL